MQIDGSEKLSDFPPDEAQRSFLKLSVVSERLQLRIPSRVDWIELAVMYLANKAQTIGACDEDRQKKVVTALTEAITNAIVHGNLEINSALKEQSGEFARVLAERSSDPSYAERTVDIEMDYDGCTCTWRISDHGKGFDVDATLKKLDEPPDPEADPTALLASGRGIMLMRAFLDDVKWSNGGRCVEMTITRETGGERRTAPRTPTLGPVRAVPLGDDGQIDWQKAFDAVATNVSRGGVGMIAGHLGNAQRLMLELKVEGETVYVPAEVMNLRRVDDSVMQIGCRFALPAPRGDVRTTEEALQQQSALDRVLSGLAAPTAVQDERRQHARMAYTRPIQVLTQDGERAAVARDLSKSGIAFVAEFEMQKGEPVTIVLDGDSDDPIHLWGQVVRCHRVAGRFHDIGVKFLD